MTYLITGGTGSMGKQLTKYLLADHRVTRIVIYSRDEYKHAVMEREFADSRLRFFLGDVRDEARLRLALGGIDYCIHTAALKRVERGEYDPQEFIKTNILGSQAVISSCAAAKVKRAVLLSTDKSVEAINLYGQTKAVAESLFISSCCSYMPIYSVVRYGNVVNSRGSVIPYFRELAKISDTLPVTWPNMTRFAMTYQMAIDLIMRAIEAPPQQVFVAKAPSFSLLRLCVALDREMDVQGAGPKEKLHEVLIHKYEANRAQDFGDHFRIRPEIPYDDEIVYEQGRVLEPWTEYSSYRNPDWLSVDDIKDMICTLGE